jgi:alpha-tubulin suppressor-like RCC1 family protein
VRKSYGFRIMVGFFFFATLFQFPYLATPTPQIVKATGGAAFTMALFDDGTLKAWGRNRSGELGTFNTDEIPSGESNKITGIDLAKKPIKVTGIENVTDISSGGFFTIALTSDKSVYGWGDNSRVAFQSPETSDFVRKVFKPFKLPDVPQAKRISTSFDGSFIQQPDGQVLVGGIPWLTNNARELTPVEDLESFQDVRGGNGLVIALMEDGTVKEPGSKGRLDLVKGLTDVIAIAAGSHALALRKDGTVWAWGENRVGQLGNGSTSEKETVTPVVVPGLKDVVQIAAGVEHSMALLKDGTVRAWGWNAYGQLGNGTTTKSKVPVVVKYLKNVVYIGAGMAHSMAILKDGTLKTWGLNENGQLGNGTTKNSSMPTTVKF